MVTDYDFTLDGVNFSFTIDHEKGDFIHDDPDAFRILLETKPSKINPRETLAREEVTVYKAHVRAYWKKERELTELDPQDQQNWLDAFKDSVGGTIQ